MGKSPEDGSDLLQGDPERDMDPHLLIASLVLFESPVWG